MRRLGSKTGTGDLTFGPTSGGISGVIGVLCGLGLAVSTVPHGLHVGDLPFLFGGLAFASLAWAMLLRPRVRLHADDVELRNAFSEFRIPYSSISEIAIRSYTVVHANDHDYIGLAVGRSRRSMTMRRKDEPVRERPDMAVGRSLVNATEAELLETTLDDRIRQARDLTPSPVRRHWALPEVLALSVFLLAFVVSLFLT